MSSIVDYLKSKGQSSNFASRAKLAANLGITNYTGTAAQNTQLLKMLQGGGSSAPSASNFIGPVLPKPGDPGFVGPTQPVPQATPSAQPQIISQPQSTSQPTLTSQPGPITPPQPSSTPTSGDGSLPSTGNAQLDGLLTTLKGYLNSVLAAGQVINPAVQITPEMIQQFISEAKTNIDPFYSAQITAIENDLNKNLTNLFQQNEINAKQEGIKFAQDLSSQRESFAGAGEATSGLRGLAEKQLTESEQNTLNLDELRTASSAAAQARSAEQTIGTSNTSRMSLPNLFGFSASAEGEGSVVPGSIQNYFTPGETGATTGSLEYQQNTDIQNAVSALRQQKVQELSNPRTLNSLTTT